MTTLLGTERRPVNRERARRLMRKMGIVTLDPKPRTSKAATGHKISGMTNQVWAPDVTVWRSLKHEDIYLKGYVDGREARAGFGAWVAFYNARRPRQALADPMAVWREGVTGRSATHLRT